MFSSLTFASESVVSTSDSKPKLSIPSKNTINLSYQHGLGGVSFQRNYYDYASAIINVGSRQDPSIMAISAGSEWTTEESTLHSGIYLNPSIVYLKTGVDRNRRFNDAYHKLYGVNLRQDDQALGLSFILKYKWIFNRKSTSYVIGAGTEFLRVRSSNGLGLTANLGIIF